MTMSGKKGDTQVSWWLSVMLSLLTGNKKAQEKS